MYSFFVQDLPPLPARELVTSESPPSRVAPLDFTEEQRQLIRDTFANGCSDAEFAVLMEVARARRLNPLFRQIHFVQRWDSDKHRMVWAAQASIDGLRAIAQRTGLYQGQDEPEFVEHDDGTLKLCKVRVWRKDWPRPAVGVAYWNEYVQTTRDKHTGKLRPTAMWARMPHVMLAKVAEAIALRKAFPEDMAGLYTTDEMAQAMSAPLPAQAPVPHRTECHVAASLPAVAVPPDEAPGAPSALPAPLLAVPIKRAVSPSVPMAATTNDPWLDYYG
jgi:phage recombination protein Bet